MSTASSITIAVGHGVETARHYITRAVSDPRRRDALVEQVAAQQPANATDAIRYAHTAIADENRPEKKLEQRHLLTRVFAPNTPD